MGPTLHVIIKANDDIDNNEDALRKRTLIKCVKSIKNMNGHLYSVILLNLYLVTHSKNDECQSISLKIIFYTVEFGTS